MDISVFFSLFELVLILLRLEFDLAMQSNDLKRALACFLTMSNSRDVGQETAAADATDVTQILNLAVAKQAKQESLADAVQGIANFVKEFFDLIDAADATGHWRTQRVARVCRGIP